MDYSRMVVDTSILIAFLRARNKSKTLLYNIPSDTEVHLSVVTVYELLMGANDEIKKKDLKSLILPFVVLPLDQAMVEKAGEIYHDLKKRNQLIEFRDIFIAATAIHQVLPLFTLNKKHFGRIQGLTLIEP